MTDCFEKAFDAFLEKKEYDDAQEALFQLVRAAFLAGWQAAKEEHGEQKSTTLRWCFF